MKKVLFFFGTRPEAIKMAPVVKKFKSSKKFNTVVVVSAQHRSMLDQVLKGFEVRSQADLNIMKRGQSLTDITTRVLQRFEYTLKRHKPDMVMVHGDTTTTLAGALASFYRKVPVAHVEAGLRTHDMYRPYPEEMNRHLTDALCALHFAPTLASQKSLKKENVRPRGIFVTGNTVIDALLDTVHRVKKFKNQKLRSVVAKINRNKGKIVLLTAHRRENFGKPFQNAFSAIRTCAEKYKNYHWVYPVHPNPHVQKEVKRFLKGKKNIHLLSPIEYDDLVLLMKKSTFVVTDSGGIQEEAPSLGKPVLVLRDVTERPEAVRAGTVRLVGTNKNKILREVGRLIHDARHFKKMANAVNPYGDGKASQRIMRATQFYFGMGKKPRGFI